MIKHGYLLSILNDLYICHISSDSRIWKHDSVVHFSMTSISSQMSSTEYHRPFLSIVVQHSVSKGESLFLLCTGKNGAMDALRKSGMTQKNASFTTALCKTEDKSIDHLPMTWRFLRFIFCRFIELLGA